MRKAGWDEDQKDYFTITNILSTIILLGASWATCSTWLSGPFMLPCVGAVWAALTLIFFKNPISAFVIAISLVVAVIAYPQPLTTLSTSPSISTQQDTTQQNIYSQAAYSHPDTIKQTQKEWPHEPPPQQSTKEPQQKYKDQPPPKYTYSEYTDPKGMLTFCIFHSYILTFLPFYFFIIFCIFCIFYLKPGKILLP
jgi:hypothetical protein